MPPCPQHLTPSCCSDSYLAPSTWGFLPSIVLAKRIGFYTISWKTRGSFLANLILLDVPAQLILQEPAKMSDWFSLLPPFTNSSSSPFIYLFFAVFCFFFFSKGFLLNLLQYCFCFLCFGFVAWRHVVS